MNDTELLNKINKDYYENNLKMGFRNIENAKYSIDKNCIGYINKEDSRYEIANNILKRHLEENNNIFSHLNKLKVIIKKMEERAISEYETFGFYDIYGEIESSIDFIEEHENEDKDEKLSRHIHETTVKEVEISLEILALDI